MSWLWVPLLVCWLLAGVHAVLGFRVIARNIIFLDLALAQLAALGAMLGMAMGLAPEGMGVSLAAMGMTSLGAVFFVLIPEKYRGVSQEVMIGLVYVMAVAGVMIALHSSPAVGHHLTEMLVGNILFIPASELWSLVMYYAVLMTAYALVRYVILPRLGAGSRWHDFVFYLFFGWAVTSSVKVAGVLLVFVFLIVPAVAALWWGVKSPFRRWVFAWGIGLVFSSLGVLLSVKLDWPTGAAIVLAAGMVLACLRLLLSAKSLT
jgi:zinc/manganese transport system permease protein